MAIASVYQSPAAKMSYVFPVSGAGANIPVGTVMMPGATGGTNKGVAIPCTASSNLGGIGLLAEKHNYSASGDATTATLVSWFGNGILGSGNTAFPSHAIELFNSAVICRFDYSLSPTGVAVASATSTVITITSTEANLDGGWAYVYGGTGIGQLEFIKSSTTGAWTVASAMGTTLDSTSTLVKVLPHFHEYPVWLVNTTTNPTLLDSTAAIGTGRGSVLGSYIVNGNVDARLDPKVYHNTTKWQNVTNFALYSHVAMIDTLFSPLA